MESECVSFQACKEVRKLQEDLLKALKEYIGEDDDTQELTIPDVMKTLQSTKRNIKKMQNEFKQNVEKELAMKSNYGEKVQVIRPYIDECVEICLLMNIQEPPMELKGLLMSCYPKFNLSEFNPYMKSGDIIEYIVWPAMYLYREGPLMCKGVAQGLRNSSSVLKSTNAIKADN
ncbi:hypothetical protein CHS0354_030866 [Potamilus streckersoni]|uniref:Mitochondria-eating protein C-terminal domain-containing protein n=1 Tax=Potamilus streckersoni TaxID=2493646 RepID=A0AAE0SMZ2_9BIVA|nr:hypothetical protein CHS0354_030866 [Potamilus streckersoni]